MYVLKGELDGWKITSVGDTKYEAIAMAIGEYNARAHKDIDSAWFMEAANIEIVELGANHAKAEKIR